MRRWLYDNPWIWIVVLLGSVVASSLVLVVIAELNRPEIVREKKEQPAPQDTAWRLAPLQKRSEPT